jgi:flagellar M-ring protein FliF
MMLVAATLTIVVVGYFGYQRLNQPNWAVLYANVDDKTASTVLAALDAHGVTYKVDGNGTRILVPKDQLSSSRLALAGDGVTAQPQPEGFDEIFANQGLASSDFEQRVNYERALEGELARTLLTMEPVAGARVALSIPEPSIFIGDGTSPTDKPTASVVLSLRRDLTRAESDTIANVVASSVEGLTPDQVTIAAADGTLLRAAGSDDSSSTSATSTKNMEITREFENGLSTRLTDLARTLTGEANAKVEVRAVLDFTESSTEQEVIDPSKNTPTAEHETTENWTGSGGNAGGVTGADGGPSAASGSTNGTYEKTDKTTTYTPGDRTITRSTTSTPSVERLSVAVVVPVTPNADGKIDASVDEDTLSRVLGPAAGIDTERGDTIEVAVVPATVTDTGDLITDPGVAAAATPAKSQTTTLIEAAAGGAVFMMLFSAYMRRRRKKKQLLRAAASGMAIPGKKSKKSKKGEPVTTEVMPTLSTAAPADPERQAVDEIRNDLERIVNESPESLAALLSTWMAK